LSSGLLGRVKRWVKHVFK